MDHRHIKDALYAQFARIGRALASDKRLEILDLLAQGERPVEAIARETTLTMGNTSAHLQTLRRARLVESRKKGQQVFYRDSTNSPASVGRWRAINAWKY